MNKTSKSNATYKACKAQVRRATKEQAQAQGRQAYSLGVNSMKIELKEGEQVKAICNHAYQIKEGKIYTIIKFEPEFYDNTSNPSGFIWPPLCYRYWG